MEQLDERIEAQRTTLDQLRPVMPRLFLIEVEYDLAMTEAEARWVRAFLGELTSGAVPGIEAWRRYYETGELPADLGEFVD